MAEKSRSPEISYEQKMEKLRAHFDNIDTYIVYTFSDAVIIKDYKEGKYFEIEYSVIDDKIVSGEKKEVEVIYIQKRLLDEAKKHIEDEGMNEALKVYLHYSEKEEYPGEEEKEENKSVELTGPIFKKTEKQRIVYAAVLVPGEPDLDADKGEKILTEEEVEQVAHKWMEEYGNIDYMHGLNNVAKPVESFILPMDYEVEAYGEKISLPKGTWVLAAKVVNDKAWKEVEEGKLTGFSIMGIQNNVLKNIMDSVSKGKRVDKELSAAMKRVLIKDLGKNWIVPFVSLVDNACVPKSKFFAIKQKNKDTNNKEGGVWDRIINIFKIRNDVEKAGRSISDATFTKLKNALEALQVLIDKADKERKPKIINSKMKGDELEMEEKDVIKLIDESLEEKLKPIHEGLKALLPKEEEEEKTEKKEEEEEEKEGGDAKKEKEEEKEEKDEEKETLKAENITLKETLEKLTAEKKKIEDAKKAKSKAEKGQEDEEEKKTYTTKDHLDDLGRDSMGRPVKKEKK